jgi:hypothetical protein
MGSRVALAYAIQRRIWAGEDRYFAFVLRLGDQRSTLDRLLLDWIFMAERDPRWKRRETPRPQNRGVSNRESAGG